MQAYTNTRKHINIHKHKHTQVHKNEYLGYERNFKVDHAKDAQMSDCFDYVKLDHSGIERLHSGKFSIESLVVFKHFSLDSSPLHG